jgi:predicted RNA-binding protein with PIN domain
VHVIVDGYNLLPHSGCNTRDEFIAKLSDYHLKRGHRVTVVFDGTHGGTGRGTHTFSGGVEVIFSPITVQADDVIEEILSRSRDPERIVVSSDRRIQSSASQAGSTYATSAEFAEYLQGRVARGPSRGGRKLKKNERKRRSALRRL